MDKILKALKTKRVDILLEKPILERNMSLNDLLKLTITDKVDYRKVAECFDAYLGFSSEFWKQLRSRMGLKENNVEDIKEVTDLAIVTAGYMEAMTRINTAMKDHGYPKVNNIRDLAKLNSIELKAFFDQIGLTYKLENELPEGYENTESYVMDVYDKIERLYPDVSLVAEIVSKGGIRAAGSSVEVGLDMMEFMDNNPDFQLYSDDVDRFCKDHNTLLSENSKAQVKVVQRIHRLSPKAKTASGLLNQKLYSASSIYKLGKIELVKSLSEEGISKKEAETVYKKATLQYANALSVVSRFGGAFNGGNPYAIGDFILSEKEREDLEGESPDYKNLFGERGFVDAHPCETLYGAPAYLSDLLRFLENKPAINGGAWAQEVLFQRRPDIGNVKLNTKNTTTMLPYIDLVNEILENTVPPVNQDFDFQTNFIANELRALPEHTRTEAYEVLRRAKYPIRPIFNLWQEEARLFLKHVKVERHELMALLSPTMENKSEIQSIEIAGEYFGIPSEELRLILPSDDAGTMDVQDEFWDRLNRESKVQVIRFLDRTGLRYNELMDLLQVRFINQDHPISVIERTNDESDFEKQFVTNLDVRKYDRIHRFLRLWRHTNWSMWELDLLIGSQSVANNLLNEDCLIGLWNFRKLQMKLSVSVEEGLALIENMNNKAYYDSRYNRQPTLLDRLIFSSVILRSKEEAPKDFGDFVGQLEDNKELLAPCLGVNESDYDFLVRKTDGHVNIENLSMMYRYVLLGRKLKLELTELESYGQVTEFGEIFESIHKITSFIDMIHRIDKAGFDVTTLRYILGGTTVIDSQSTLGELSNDEQIGFSFKIIRAFMDKMSDNLVNLKDCLKDSKKLDRDRLEKYLRMAIVSENDPVYRELMTLMEGKWQGTEVEKDVFIEGLYGYLSKGLVYDMVRKLLRLSESTASVVLDQLVVEMPDGPSFIKMTLGEGLLCGTEEQAILSLKALKKLSLIVSILDLEGDEFQWYVENFKEAKTLDLSQMTKEQNYGKTGFDALFTWVEFVDFQKHYKKVNEDFLGKNTDRKTFDPITSETLEQLSDTIVEDNRMAFYRLLKEAFTGSVTVDALISDLSDMTGWKLASLKTICDHLKVTSEDFNLSGTYLYFERCFDLLDKLKVSAEIAVTWSVRETTSDRPIADSIRQSVKLRYNNDQWLKKSVEIVDQLRMKKRDGLVAYLIERSKRHESSEINKVPNPRYWETEEDLCNYLLIDVKMNPMQMTSRIKQAISSVQFFIQRCFINREAYYVQVPLKDPDEMNNWNQWRWMKNYRIWEANRKVFFYPENWIEPELRDDKSPFFQDMENELMQSEINHNNVENAYRNYLQKVDDVANLELIGVYDDYQINEKLLYVLGRSRSLPARFYLRHYDIEADLWSPWEHLEVEIGSDNVMPVVYNRRLYLFWLEIMEKPMKVMKSGSMKVDVSGNDASVNPQDVPENRKYLEIQLAWTYKKHMGWAAKTISSKKLVHPWERPMSSFMLKPRYNSGDNRLHIELFISTSESFNNGWFYDQLQQKKVQLSDKRFDEAAKPWHSSTFIFDGNIVGIKLRGLKGSYGMLILDEKTGKPVFRRVVSDSYKYVHNFFEDGKEIAELIKEEASEQLTTPYGMHYEHSCLVNNKVHNVTNGQMYTLDQNNLSIKLLDNTHDFYKMVVPYRRYGRVPFFYQDAERSFLVKPEQRQLFLDKNPNLKWTGYVFKPMYHPYTDMFTRELNRDGIDGLLNRNVQVKPSTMVQKNSFDFTNHYKPIFPSVVDKTAKQEIVDFSFSGSYSIYNWEIFFHGPMFIANKLKQNQRFEEAMRWYHYVFDPTNVEDLPTPQRFWVTKPFYEMLQEEYLKQQIENIANNIDEFAPAVAAWKNNPFKPHLIARYRPVAFQRNVFMKYLDNMMDWADQLFRRDSMESVNEALMMYILAKDLLGNRPTFIPRIEREDKNYNELDGGDSVDIFGNDRVEVLSENLAGCPVSVVSDADEILVYDHGRYEPLPILDIGYFSIPYNDKLLKYWDLVDDRLYKIRNSLNIDGIFRQMALFEPPIDPGMLVKAAASGITDFGMLNEFATPNPKYRFRVLLESAIRFTKELEGLGEKLLMILEKKDAEGLAVLRATHEEALLKSMEDIKKLEIEASKEMIEGLKLSLSRVQRELDYFDGDDPKEWEYAAYSLHAAALTAKHGSAVYSSIAAGLSYVWDFVFGVHGVASPVADTKAGGSNWAKAMKFLGDHSDKIADALKWSAEKAEGFDKKAKSARKNEMIKDQVKIDKTIMESRIKATEIRESMAEKERDNHKIKIGNMEVELAYYKNKYTNQALYNWMVSQISSVYFGGYQLAYDMAKRAEKSFRYELGLKDSSYIEFGHWDSLHKGLLSGERLMQNLMRLESAYYDEHKREYELVKDISLKEMAPLRLVELIFGGSCKLDLEEWMFNMDYPSHYKRRIKSVSVSVLGDLPKDTQVHCTLSLESSKVRMDNIVGEDYNTEDHRFYKEFGEVQSIATSYGQKDHGLFELRYEDNRYLPFEGAGAISTWNIELPSECNRFDKEKISDVVLHLQYTAREGGEGLATAASEALKANLPNEGLLMLSLKNNFTELWNTYVSSLDGSSDRELVVNIHESLYPYDIRGRGVPNITALHMTVLSDVDKDLVVDVTLSGQNSGETLSLVRDSSLGDVHHGELTVQGGAEGIGDWNFKLRAQDGVVIRPIFSDEIEDVIVVVAFELTN